MQSWHYISCILSYFPAGCTHQTKPALLGQSGPLRLIAAVDLQFYTPNQLLGRYKQRDICIDLNCLLLAIVHFISFTGNIFEKAYKL